VINLFNKCNKFVDEFSKDENSSIKGISAMLQEFFCGVNMQEDISGTLKNIQEDCQLKKRLKSINLACRRDQHVSNISIRGVLLALLGRGAGCFDGKSRALSRMTKRFARPLWGRIQIRVRGAAGSRLQSPP